MNKQKRKKTKKRKTKNYPAAPAKRLCHNVVFVSLRGVFCRSNLVVIIKDEIAAVAALLRNDSCNTVAKAEGVLYVRIKEAISYRAS